MKKSIKIMLTIATLATPLVVLAQEPAPVKSDLVKIPVACEKITAKVTTRIAKFSEVNANHDIKSNQVISRVTEISSKLKARGIDTSALDAQIVLLQDKRSKLESSKQALVAKLEESKQLTCGASQGQFKTKIAEAKVLQKTVVTDVKSMHDTAKSIRDTVKALRPQVASSTAKTV